MKRIVLLIVLLVAASQAWAAECSITGPNTWSEPVKVEGPAAFGATAGSGDWAALVRLQYCLPGDDCSRYGSGWTDTGDYLNRPGARNIWDGCGMLLRIGVGDEYGYGTFKAWIRP
jgi:hypothetical protein